MTEDEKKLIDGTNLQPLTMEDFNKDTIRGKRVFAQIKVGVNHYRIEGTAGWAWGRGGHEPIVKFDTGITISINERNVGRFYLQPTN